MHATSTVTEPDVDLSTAIQRAFQLTGRTWLLHLQVDVNGPVVVLRGEVPSFYLKQLAQEAVFTLPGVATLKNEVHVADRATRQL